MVVSHSHMGDAYTDIKIRIIVFVVVYVGKSLGKTEGAGGSVLACKVTKPY